MGMGPKSICYHQILPEIEGKQLVFSKSPYIRRQAISGRVTLGRLVG